MRTNEGNIQLLKKYEENVCYSTDLVTANIIDLCVCGQL